MLMDVQMPIMDGFEATRWIRQQAEAGGPALPIVAMTAHALKGDRERCLAAGMDSYVSKPIDAEQLYQAIEDALAAVARCRSAGSSEFSRTPHCAEPDAQPSPARPAAVAPLLAAGVDDSPQVGNSSATATARESLVDWSVALAQVGGDETGVAQDRPRFRGRRRNSPGNA